jgi:hypothetical protein
MSYSLSFSPEFFSSEDDFSSDKPFTVEQAIAVMDPDCRADMVREVFSDFQPETVTDEMIASKVRETNTCGTISSPVDVWIDPEGSYRVDVFEAPRHIPEPGTPGVPLCGNEAQGETVAWLDRAFVANCSTCQALEAALD